MLLFFRSHGASGPAALGRVLTGTVISLQGSQYGGNSENFVEGWTAPIDYQLKKNGAAFYAVGMTVELILRDKAGSVVTEGGTTDWSNAAQSTARYNPASTDLTFARSPMRVHWKVTDGAGKVAFFPKGEFEEWRIHQA